MTDVAGFRVTKYDPDRRLPNGTYSRDEWTSVSDIGRAYGGQVFNCADYLRVETSYVLAVQRFLDAAHVGALRVSDLQVNEIGVGRNPCELVGEVREHIASVVDGAEVRGKDLEWIIRLALREVLWCRLKGEQGFYVHFGYDYYMYVGSEALVAVPPQIPAGVFVEACESPYHGEEAASNEESG
ncbi:MAG TPA: hypothetical protein PLI95_21015 [Polyangiaceae bacterium]|nr:hypothetical protein [Polyangiaceae bacterium]